MSGILRKTGCKTVTVPRDVRRLHAVFASPGWNSDAFFYSCLKNDRDDHEINPLEDAIISRMYLVEYKTSQEIADYLDRSVRAINLRLRMMFDLLPEPVCLSISDKLAIAKFFRKRSEKYLDFCRKVIIAANPEHEVALLEDGEELLREALEIFLDHPLSEEV